MLSEKLSKKLDEVIHELNVLQRLSSRKDEKNKSLKKDFIESSLGLNNPKTLSTPFQLETKSDCTNLLPKI
jgi:hypothetical protein